VHNSPPNKPARIKTALPVEPCKSGQQTEKDPGGGKSTADGDGILGVFCPGLRCLLVGAPQPAAHVLKEYNPGDPHIPDGFHGFPTHD
jgi:hypothetical protein